MHFLEKVHYFSYELLNIGYEALHTASSPGTTMQNNDKSLLNRVSGRGICSLNELAGYIMSSKACNVTASTIPYAEVDSEVSFNQMFNY